MWFRHLALMGTALLLATLLSGQTVDDLLREAHESYRQEAFSEALGTYLLVRQIEPSNKEVLVPLADCYLRKGEPESALPLLREAVNMTKADPQAYLLVARALHLTDQYELATQAYKGYLQRTRDDAPDRPTVKADILRCGFASRWQYHEAIAFVDNLGPTVNSPDDETAPALSPNYPERLYFSSNREGVSGGKRNNQGLSDPAGQRKLDLYLSELQPDGWSPPFPLPDLLNSPAHDIIQDFNADGSVLYVFKGLHLQAGKILTDTFGRSHETKLLPDRFPGPVMAETGDTDLFFFNDSTALFASRAPDGFGGTDLYLAAFRAGRWRQPMNLGPQINSQWDERMPVLMPDGVTLYFASDNARRSIGGFDIFQATFNIPRGVWEPPVNLGTPINSAGDDLYFRPASDGINAWFASNRPGGHGGLDLYAAFFKQPRIEQSSPSVSGSFFDILQKGPASTSNLSDSVIAKTPYSFKMIFFDTEEDITARQNQSTLDQAAALLKAYPELQVAIQAHSDQTNTPIQYDLYYSIKRAERAKTYLIDAGVNQDQIALQGLGPQYPQALERLQGQNNSQGSALNRRLHLTFLQQKPLPLLLSMEAPIISSFMRASLGDEFVATIEGLTWRVEVASATGLYNNPVFTTLPDLMVEQLREPGQLKYCAGLFTDYQEAVAFAETLPEKGLPEGKPHPYLNGLRMNDQEVTGYLDKFPDLLRYLARKNR